MIKQDMKLLYFDYETLLDIIDIFEKYNINHESFLGNYENMIEFKEYIDNNKLDNNSIYYAIIENNNCLVLSKVEKFHIYTTVCKAFEYMSNRKLTFINKFDNILVFNIDDVNYKFEFYKYLQVDYEKLPLSLFISHMKVKRKKTKKNKNEDDDQKESN